MTMMGDAGADSDRAGLRPPSFRDQGGVRVALSAIAATFILLIYSNVADLLPGLPTVGPVVARLVIYGAFAVGSVAVAWLAVQAPPKTRTGLLVAAYGTVLITLIGWQAVSAVGFGVATRSFVAGIVQVVGFGYLLGLRPARGAVNLSITIVVAVTVVCCAADVAFGLFSQTPGRGAGLYFNPNVAALALLLGGIGLVQALPPAARLPVAAFIALGLAATLSRSGLLTALLVVLACTMPICAGFRRDRASYRSGAWGGAAVLVIGFAYFTYAYFTPSVFSSKIAWAQQHVIGSPIVDAERNGATASDGGVTKTETIPPIDCTSWTAILQGLRRAQACPWLASQFIGHQEEFNSGAARIIFALRGAAAFFDAPWFGSGLDRAFSLAPHNSYLLFAIAYGVLGLLVLPAFCLFVALRMGARNGLPVIVFVLVAGAFSHDIFLSRDLVAGLAIALSVSDRAWQN